MTSGHAWEQNYKLRPEASLHKGGGKGGVPLRGPPPSWESCMEAVFRPEFGI
jgi:hypothetical protein